MRGLPVFQEVLSRRLHSYVKPQFIETLRFVLPAATKYTTALTRIGFLFPRTANIGLDSKAGNAPRPLLLQKESGLLNTTQTLHFIKPK